MKAARAVRGRSGVSQPGAWPVWSAPGRFLSFLSWSGAAVTAAPVVSCSPWGPWGKLSGGNRESSDESSVKPGRSPLLRALIQYFFVKYYKAHDQSGEYFEAQFSYFTGTILPGFLWSPSLAQIHHRMMLVWIMTESVRMTRLWWWGAPPAPPVPPPPRPPTSPTPKRKNSFSTSLKKSLEI